MRSGRGPVNLEVRSGIGQINLEVRSDRLHVNLEGNSGTGKVGKPEAEVRQRPPRLTTVS